MSTEAFASELRDTLAEHLGLPVGQVAVGNNTLAFASHLVGPGGTAVYGNELSLVDATTSLIILPSPTALGEAEMTTADFEAFMEQVPAGVTVLLDETQLEYPDEEDSVVSTDAIARHSNLVVLRSYAKSFGLADVRVFYAFGSEPTISALA